MEKGEGILKDRTEANLRELQTIISVFYILMVGIGMLFEYQRYKLFGINIFEYADVFDFLIAPFKSPLIIFLFIFLSLSIAYVAFKLDLYIQKKSPKIYRITSLGWDKKSWYGIFRLFSIVLVFVSYIYYSSDYLAGKFHKEFNEKNKMIRVFYSDNSFSTGKLIGKTNETLFLLEDETVKVIPTNSLVKQIDTGFSPFSEK